MSNSMPASLKIVHVLRAPLGGLFRHVVDLTREHPNVWMSAMTNLGVMYYEGRGVSRNPQLGLDLLNRAARAGDKRASDYLVEIGEKH